MVMSIGTRRTNARHHAMCSVDCHHYHRVQTMSPPTWTLQPILSLGSTPPLPAVLILLPPLVPVSQVLRIRIFALAVPSSWIALCPTSVTRLLTLPSRAGLHSLLPRLSFGPALCFFPAFAVTRC